eukprot:jgi/Chrpa1/23112/Chrysochromulina_OHIO_Genome00024960-RA
MEEMSISECCIAIVGFLAVIPSMLAALMGMDTGDGLLETFLDEGVNAAANVAEEAAAIAAVMDNLLFNMRQKYAANKINGSARKRYGKNQGAATKVQSKVRAHQVRTRQRWQGAGEKDLAAILIQRAFLTKRNLKREGVSLRKVQMNQIRYRTALKSRVGIGSHWTNVGPEKPAAGSEIFSKRLAAALRTKQEFSNEEVAAFEVLLRIDSFIKVDEQYFEQVGSAGSSSVEGGQAADVHAATEPAAAETAVVEPLTTAASAVEPVAAAADPPSALPAETAIRPPLVLITAEDAWHASALVAAGPKAVEPATTEPSSTSPVVKAAMEAAAREAAAREAAARGDLAFLAFVADPKAAVAAATSLAWGKSGASEMEVAVAQEHLERQNTEAATLERRKMVKSERLKSLEEKAAAALEKLEAATAEAREAAAREAAARGDLAFLAFVADPKTAPATLLCGNSDRVDV